MLFAALTNAVCLYNAFFVIDLCKCFLFSCFVFVYFIFVICIMHSAFNLFVFLIICSHCCCFFFFVCVFVFIFLIYFLRKGHELSGEIALKNNHYYYYYYIRKQSYGIKNIHVTDDLCDSIKGSCGKKQTYISKTKRHLATTVWERLSGNSAIIKHISCCNACNHSTIENFHILSHGSNDEDSEAKEAMYTKKQKSSFK